MAARKRRFAIVIDAKRCINCKSCVVACRAENDVPLAYSRNWINEELRGNYPRLLAAFEPEQCHHCEDAACVRVCPTGASYKRPDGIVSINAAECVGCRYCILACPYEARFFREEKGVVEKCDLCSERVDRGDLPACVETCPGKVRVFGDMNDPNSELARLLVTHRYFVKKPEAGTDPHIYYLL